MKVACAIIIDKGQFFVCQRPASKSLPYKWEFPGGKIEVFETKEECLLRELKEELCLDVKIIQSMGEFQHDYGSFAVTLFPFLCTIEFGAPVLTEHLAYKWVTCEQAWDLDLADADKPVLRHLQQIL